MKTASLLLVLLFIAACQGPQVRDQNSPYYIPPVGSKLALNQTITIPAHTASVFIQGGRVAPDRAFNPVNQYYTNCKFEVRDVKDVPQTVLPDEFTVERVRQIQTTVALAFPLLADAGGGAEDGGPAMQRWGIEFYLNSAKQPDVLRLTCQHVVHGYEGRNPTFSEISKTLGPVFTWKPAP